MIHLYRIIVLVGTIKSIFNGGITMKKVMSLGLVAALLISMLTFITINVGAEAWDGVAEAEFAGKGTAENPYRIENAANLNYLQRMVNEGITYEEEYFVQTADIDLGGKEWTPIGDPNTPFKGVYDGKGKKITNLSITKDRSAIGLFGYVSSGTSKAAGLANINVEGKIEVEGIGDRGVGGLCGWLYKDSDNLYPPVYVTNCVVDVDITLDAAGKQPRVGGAFGYAFCAIVENVVYKGTANITATANSRLGGITGQTNRTIYRYCVNDGELINTLTNCTAHIGGIAGMLTYKTSDYNYDNGLTGEDHEHKAYTVFDHCVNNGKVSATVATGEKSKVYLGGIVGATYSPSADKTLNVKVLYCVNTGELYGMIDPTAPEGNYAYVGGIFARANLVNIQIENCINTSDKITSLGGVSGECKGGIVAEMKTGAETEYLKNCETVGKLGGMFENKATDCIENATATDAMVHAKEITDTLKSSTIKIGDFPTDTLEIPAPSVEPDDSDSKVPDESDSKTPDSSESVSESETKKPEEPTTPDDTKKVEPSDTNKTEGKGGCKSGIVTIVPAIMIGLAALVVAKKKED